LYAQPRKYNGYKYVIEEAYRCVIISVTAMWMGNLNFNILRLLNLWSKCGRRVLEILVGTTKFVAE